MPRAGVHKFLGSRIEDCEKHCDKLAVLVFDKKVIQSLKHYARIVQSGFRQGTHVGPCLHRDHRGAKPVTADVG